MFATTEECVERYIEELREYKAWVDERKRIYGEDSCPLGSWGNDDWSRLNGWNAEMKAMERVLGLDEEEVARHCQSIGMKP